MRRIALAVVMLALVAGCTSGNQGEVSSKSTTGGEDGPTTTLDPQWVGRAPGVTPDAIKIGISYPDLTAIRSITSLDFGDTESKYRAVIDDINRRGGINGRKIVPIFAGVSPIDTKALDATCVKFTEDEKVFVVMGFFYGDVPLCYLETHKTALIDGDMNEARLARAKAPWFSTVASSDLQADAVRKFADQGLLDDPFAVEVAAADKELLTDTVAPLLKKLGAVPVSTGVLDAPITDQAAAVNAGKIIAEKFKNAGAKRVLLIGNGGIQWVRALETTDYRPQNLFITTAGILSYAADAAGRDLSVLDHSIAADLFGPPSRNFKEPKMQACIRVVEKATGLTIKDPATVPDGQPNDAISAEGACRLMALFSALVRAAGRDLDYATYAAGAGKAGHIRLPGEPGTRTYGPPPKADGDPAIYLYQWSSSAKTYEPYKS
jgi:ABC-type branched-subunit amino acid transport system substrate-binding protein